VPHEVDRFHREARLEIPVLVEHVVRGQQRLVVSGHDRASAAERRGIEERLSSPCRVRSDTPDDEAETLIGQRGDAIEQIQIRADECVMVQQVARGIPRRRQLREHGELCAFRPGAIHGRADLSVRVLECTDCQIQLRRGNAHRPILAPRGPISKLRCRFRVPPRRAGNTQTRA
jgi:hypothetical protein